MGSSKASQQRLYAVAASQQGFFTAKQAKTAGYQDSVHGYHVRNGDWEKAYRGVYFLTRYPRATQPELVLWSLWSRGRDDAPKAVFSHQTALAIHRGNPVDVSQLHLTVPLDFRRGTSIPEHLVLHMAELEASDIEEHDGYRVTTLRRTRADLGQAPRRTSRESTPEEPAMEAAPARRLPSPPPRKDWAVW